jgi:hypothetical protein
VEVATLSFMIDRMLRLSSLVAIFLNLSAQAGEVVNLSAFASARAERVSKAACEGLLAGLLPYPMHTMSEGPVFAAFEDMLGVLRIEQFALFDEFLMAIRPRGSANAAKWGRPGLTDPAVANRIHELNSTLTDDQRPVFRKLLERIFRP